MIVGWVGSPGMASPPVREGKREIRFGLCLLTVGVYALCRFYLGANPLVVFTFQKSSITQELQLGIEWIFR
jgi:hypothetical protein